MILKFQLTVVLSVFGGSCFVEGFQVPNPSSYMKCNVFTLEATKDGDTTSTNEDNKAMAFLRKIGKVGGVANVDFKNAVGVDEGPAGKTKATAGMKQVRKTKSAYTPVTVNGVIDDLSEPFPVTSSGTQWAGFTDQVMGGRSSGKVLK